MVIHLDTSALVDALTAEGPSAERLRTWADQQHPMSISAPVLYEWLRGPRRQAEIEVQELLFPMETVVPFGSPEAALAADLYRRVPRARAREFDLAVAACAIAHGAVLWTLNPKDFRDIPGLALAQ